MTGFYVTSWILNVRRCPPSCWRTAVRTRASPTNRSGLLSLGSLEQTTSPAHRIPERLVALVIIVFVVLVVILSSCRRDLLKIQSHNVIVHMTVMSIIVNLYVIFPLCSRLPWRGWSAKGCTKYRRDVSWFRMSSITYVYAPTSASSVHQSMYACMHIRVYGYVRKYVFLYEWCHWTVCSAWMLILCCCPCSLFQSEC